MGITLIVLILIITHHEVENCFPNGLNPDQRLSDFAPLLLIDPGFYFYSFFYINAKAISISSPLPTARWLNIQSK